MAEQIWTLRDNDLTNRDPEEWRGPTFELPSEEGLETVLSGRACFAISPKDPPFELVEEVNTRVKAAKLEDLGPDIDSPDYLEKINASVFPGGVRQSLSEGQSILWAKGRIGLRWMLGDAVSKCTERTSNLVAEVRWLAAGRGLQFPAGKSQSDEDGPRDFSRTFPLCELDVILSHQHRPRGADFEAWEDFARAALDGQTTFEKLHMDALRSGRILAGFDSNAGSSLVPPASLILLSDDQFTDEYSFALSGNLPASWRFGTRSLASKKREAKKWIEGAGRYFHEPGRRLFSKKVARDAIIRRYGLSENAAKSVVDGAGLPRRKSGEIRREVKVELAELMKYEPEGN